MRREKGKSANRKSAVKGHGGESNYRTYRPLSNLPTPPPTYKEAKSPSTISTASSFDDGMPLKPKFRGPAIHLVNLIPSSASLTPASVPIVQSMLSRANLSLETVALAVCILDSLDKKFARAWRLGCPLTPSSPVPSSPKKRHSLPPTPLRYQHQQRQMLHIDSVPPELIILAALVIAVKFMDDPQQHTQYYCDYWGRGTWSNEQLNVTERCIMESLNYRIMPLCDEDCLADAMVDMQLAAKQLDWEDRGQVSTPFDHMAYQFENNFILGHNRSKTTISSSASIGLGISLTPEESPCTSTSGGATPLSDSVAVSYF